jgi:hypothetical protein
MRCVITLRNKHNIIPVSFAIILVAFPQLLFSFPNLSVVLEQRIHTFNSFHRHGCSLKRANAGAFFKGQGVALAILLKIQ